MTLHVEYDDSPTNICGTEFILHGATDLDIAKAKSLFLRFAGDEILESNVYGQVLQRQASGGRVYISGVFASEEPNFLFSYNITNLTSAMKKKLNRERLNVGRTTYAERVKTIVGITGNRVPEVRISETMRVTTDNTQGVWDSSIQAIVIKRNKLASPIGYAATLLHEMGHATTGALDATREFEEVLTGYLGRTATIALGN